MPESEPLWTERADHAELIDELERINRVHFEVARPLYEAMRSSFIWQYRLEGIAIGATVTALGAVLVHYVIRWLR